MAEKKTISEDLFDKISDARGVELTIMNTKLINLDRVDYYMYCRDLRQNFFNIKGMIPLPTIRKDVEYSKAILGKMIDMFKGMVPEDFAEEDFKDPYQDLFCDCSSSKQVVDDEDLFHELIKWQLIRPFGERLVNLHHLAMEEIRKDEAEIKA